MFKRIIPFVTLAVVLAGCPEEEVTPTDVVTPTDEPMEDPAIVGDWVSTGDDVSPLFVSLGIDTIDATFEADGSYTVVSDSAGTLTTFTGTYMVDTETEPHTITLNQTSPAEATVAGIWQVDADGSMRYEVVDTALGSPPTPDGGFGVDPVLVASNVQVFQPVEN